MKIINNGMNILDNPWFVGIVGGILSGIAATWLSRFLFSKRDNREYAQKVAAVNREVIYSVRPGIPEGNIPSVVVLNALITATCRKYAVTVNDAFTVDQISEELVKEVMDSSFISSATKQEYCTQLLAMQKPMPLLYEEIVTLHKKESVESIEKLRSKMQAQMSAITGVMVATLTLFLTIFREPFSALAMGPIKELSLPLLVLAASAVGMAAVIAATMVMREARISVRKRDKNPGENSAQDT